MIRRNVVVQGKQVVPLQRSDDFRGSDVLGRSFTEGDNVDIFTRVDKRVGVRWKMIETMRETKTRR
jgi:hypothetical protein